MYFFPVMQPNRFHMFESIMGLVIVNLLQHTVLGGQHHHTVSILHVYVPLCGKI